MAKKHFIESTITDVVDPETGEVTSTTSKKTHRITLDKNDHFYMCFFETMAPYYGLKYADDLKLISKFCELAEWNTGKVSVSTSTRESICKELNINTSNLSRSIKRLRDSNLISGEKGIFTINPSIFWKGDKKSREDLLKSGGLSVNIQFSLE